MHSLWCEMHPEYNHLSQQNLRDYANHLRKKMTPQPQGQSSTPPAKAPSPTKAGGTSAAVDTTEATAVFSVMGDELQADSDLLQRLESTINYDEASTRQRNIHHKTSLRDQQLSQLNGIVDMILTETTTLWEIDCVVYAAATLLASPRVSTTWEKKAAIRQKQLSAKITLARQQVSRFQCVMDYLSSGRAFTPKVKLIACAIRRDHHTLNKSVLLTLKQHELDRVRALTTARKKLVKRTNSRKENSTFSFQPSRLFRPPPPVVQTPPTVPEVERFWKDIYETTKPFNEGTPAIAHFKEFCDRHLAGVDRPISVTESDVKKAFSGKKNFTAPGMDAVNNFWWKKFTSTHKHLARIFTSFLSGKEPIPSWLTEGLTVLIPKKGDLSNPKNYRPITCLNTVYKAFTSILNDLILHQVQPVWEEVYEQRGSKKGIAGCKDNLLIDRCVSQDACQYKRNLSMGWVDYKKAFDTTSHELILAVLRYMKVHPEVVSCIERLLPLWRTRFAIPSGKKTVHTDLVTYHRGVFQGDSLSPLLFCLSLLPLSFQLRRGRGYMCGVPSKREHKITHLFYMDDLKLYASNAKDLRLALDTVRRYSEDIGMEFGLDKCATIHLAKGKISEDKEDVQLVDGNAIRHLDDDEAYEYLGIPQRRMQEVRAVKERLTAKYRQTLRRIWSSDLSGKNKVLATNTFAVPTLLYTFGCIKWNVNELQNLDRGTRKMMTIYRSLHPKSSVARLYLPRKLGGRGLISLECLHDRVVLSTACRVFHSTDPLMLLVKKHESIGKGAFLFQAAKRAADGLGLDLDLTSSGEACDKSILSLKADVLKLEIKKAEQETLLRKHTEKPMHGSFFRNLETHGLSKELTFAFLRSAGLKSETEGFVLACQDGVINTLVYRRLIFGANVTDTRCRACRRQPETLGHLLSGCSFYAKNAYINRHNSALRVLYYYLRHHYGIDANPVLPYVPGDIESVVENDKCKIWWNYSFSTTRQLEATKPDIVLLDNLSHAMFVIEFSAPAETNMAAKEIEKRTKYQDLLCELRQMYPGYSVKLVVLIVGVLGGVKCSLVENLKCIPACRARADALASAMQKAVLLGSLRLLRAHDPAAG